MVGPGITSQTQQEIEVTQQTHDDLNANANLQVGDADVDAGNPVPVSFTAADWAPLLISEETANDSDKSFAVPANRQYQYLSVWVELITTAVVGNRQMVVEIQDGAADVIGQMVAGAVQAASLTRNYLFSPPCADLMGFRNLDFLMTPLGLWVLPATYILRVYDAAAVDAAADDMVVQIMVAERTV